MYMGKKYYALLLLCLSQLRDFVINPLNFADLGTG